MMTSRRRSAANDGLALRRTTYSKSGRTGKPCAGPSARRRGLKPLCAKIDIASPASTAVTMPESPVDCSATVHRRPALCSRSCANCRQAQGAGNSANGTGRSLSSLMSGSAAQTRPFVYSTVGFIDLAVHDCDVEQAASVQSGDVGPDAHLDLKVDCRIAAVKLGQQGCQRSRIEIFRRPESDEPLP